MSDTTVDTAECVEIVRALVKAFEEKGRPLTRELRDEYAPDNYLLPSSFDVSTELVERGLKALGLPYPKVPKPRKIPALPSEPQARVLDYLNAHADARIRSWQSWGGYIYHYELERADGSREISVASVTFERLLKFKWIVCERSGTGYNPEHYYKLTDAGREVLTRYQIK